MSLFLQVYGGCGLAVVIGFLVLCHSSATRIRHHNHPGIGTDHPLSH
jgi:hypothetical protein